MNEQQRTHIDSIRESADRLTEDMGDDDLDADRA
jgi:hypothetical protein